MTFLSRALACLLVGAVFAGTGAGCAKSEYSLLIDADSVGSLSSVRVRILPMDHSRSLSSSDERAVSRSAASLHTDPLRVAIPFEHEADVLVQILGVGAGRTFQATRCYHVDGVIRDVVMLVENDATHVDTDGDGFVIGASALCLDPDGSGGTQACDFACAAELADDCAGCVGDSCVAGDADTNASVYPGAPERCENGIDEDCNGEDTACGDHDGDGSSACRAFATPGSCDCDDQDPARNPMATDTCGDGIDQDCNGADAACDRDMDGFPANLPVGGSPDCDDQNPDIHPGATELCTADGAVEVDENCNGVFDELASCLKPDLDLDGSDACVDGATSGCDPNDCDPGINPGAPEICGNGIDEDGNPANDNCSTSDTDHDGYVGSAVGGTDCNDSDATVHPGAGDRCGDSIDQNCDSIDASCVGDTDGDLYIGADDCDETNADVNAGVTGDVCNGANDDCDLTTDEVLMTMATRGCVSTGTDGSRAELRFNSILHCGACRNACNPGTETLADVCVPDSSAGGALACDCSGDSGIRSCGGGRADACCPGNGGCVDLDSSMDSCGSCGHSCNTPMSDRCTDGNCACGSGPACSGTGEICCGGECVVPTNDPENCGACGHRCADAALPHATSKCSAGDCIVDECDTGFANCSGDGPGCGTNVRTADHCGDCTSTCDAGGTCVTGTCLPNTCSPGFGDCDGTGPGGCIQLNTNTDCTACGTSCTVSNGTGDCSSGSCQVASCNPGWDNCNGMPGDGCETNLNTSMLHCGACMQACTNADVHGTAICASGTCTLDPGGMCFANFIDCNPGSPGCEMIDMAGSCNLCGAPCTMAAVHGTPMCFGPGDCRATSCDSAGGYEDCSMMSGVVQCVNVRTSTDCGTCGTSCTPASGSETASCSTGTCVRACVGGLTDCDAGADLDCRDTNTLSDCGGCGIPCTAGTNQAASCATGTCDLSCATGYADCDASAGLDCRDTHTLTDCGGCNMACDIANASETCSTGTCHVMACDPGYGNCDADPDTCEPIDQATSCGNTCTDCTMSGGVCCDAGGGSYSCQPTC